MENYKSFREQFLECGESGNLITVDTSKYATLVGKKKFPEKILVCIKYKCVCHSGICAGERIGEQDEYPRDDPSDVGC